MRNAKVCGAPHDSVDPERLPVVRKPVYVTRFQYAHFRLNFYPLARSTGCAV